MKRMILAVAALAALAMAAQAHAASVTVIGGGLAETC